MIKATDRWFFLDGLEKHPQALGIQSPCQMMIGVSNHLLSKVFRFHYHSQKVIGSLGKFFGSKEKSSTFLFIQIPWGEDGMIGFVPKNSCGAERIPGTQMIWMHRLNPNDPAVLIGISAGCFGGVGSLQK